MSYARLLRMLLRCDNNWSALEFEWLHLTGHGAHLKAPRVGVTTALAH